MIQVYESDTLHNMHLKYALQNLYTAFLNI